MPLVRLIPIVAFLACSSTVLYAGDIEGRAKPVDGDSFNIEIRIFGIDAPEPGQTCKDAQGLNYPCGRIARDTMAELLKGKTVRCEKQDMDTKYGRPVAICYSDGLDVGAEMEVLDEWTVFWLRLPPTAEESLPGGSRRATSRSRCSYV
jgi:hypothetical protein